jgi:pimeloyl-ACP methyl ester carboxylesterase
MSSVQFLNKRVKCSKLEVIADGGHVNILEKPEEFNRVLLNFVEG